MPRKPHRGLYWLWTELDRPLGRVSMETLADHIERSSGMRIPTTVVVYPEPDDCGDAASVLGRWYEEGWGGDVMLASASGTVGLESVTCQPIKTELFGPGFSLTGARGLTSQPGFATGTEWPRRVVLPPEDMLYAVDAVFGDEAPRRTRTRGLPVKRRAPEPQAICVENERVGDIRGRRVRRSVTIVQPCTERRK